MLKVILFIKRINIKNTDVIKVKQKIIENSPKNFPKTISSRETGFVIRINIVFFSIS
jgi:hypothetical protein